MVPPALSADVRKRRWASVRLVLPLAILAPDAIELRHADRIEIEAREGIDVPVMVLVRAAHEHRSTAILLGLHMRRDEEEGEADAAVVAAVGVRAMRRPLVVERELAGPEDEAHRLALVEALDGLAARQHVGRIHLLDMLQIAARMGPRNHLDAAIRLVAVGEGDPDGHLLMGRQAEIGRILMPGDEARI